ncbi:DUF3397 domain-containing protein [Paenibacillus sp. TRM 82003]|nr:DUF3397 domain-containing protein [Paenibacillus sp. TRM 82003]
MSGKQVSDLSYIVEALKYVYAAFAVMPVLTFGLAWGIAYLWRKEKKLAVKHAMDVTTLFLFGSVAVLYNLLFQSTFGFYLLLLIFLLGFGLVGNLQHRKKGKIDLKRIARAIWRLGFVGLSAAYVLLMTATIATNLM